MWPTGASKTHLSNGALQDCPLQAFDIEVHPVDHSHCASRAQRHGIQYRRCHDACRRRWGTAQPRSPGSEQFSNCTHPTEALYVSHSCSTWIASTLSSPAVCVCYILNAPLTHKAEGFAVTGRFMACHMCLDGSLVLFEDHAKGLSLRVSFQEFFPKATSEGFSLCR